jgi:hypothetical protein
MDVIALSRHLLNDVSKREQGLHFANRHIQAAMDWLCLAQDTQSNDGVSLRYSLLKGWDSSYPETTGYIIPTFFHYAALTKKEEYFQRAVKMADWELSIQKEDGSFNGGTVGSGYDSFVFDTGQILFGLIDAHKATGKDRYLHAAIRAGQWLVQVQDEDGAWRKYTFNAIPHAYYTRVAWALAELGAHTQDSAYSKAAGRNIDWALSKQLENGWFDCAGFTEKAHATPYTHTIAYTIRGVLETGLLLQDKVYLNAARRSADALTGIMHSDGRYYDRYDRNWRPTTSVSCLTGNAQFATILFRLYKHTEIEKYVRTAQQAMRFLCRHQQLNGPPQTRGAIAGSYPIWGQYQRFAFPNWAAKFFVDALLMEQEFLARKQD